MTWMDGLENPFKANKKDNLVKKVIFDKAMFFKKKSGDWKGAGNINIIEPIKSGRKYALPDFVYIFLIFL